MATNNITETTKHYAGVKFSPKGSSWDDLEKELFTPEEIVKAKKIRAAFLERGGKNE